MLSRRWRGLEVTGGDLVDRTITLELDERQSERLARAAKQLGRTPEETVGVFLEEALREQEFPLIEFRDTAVGRQPYLRGTRLKAWMLVEITRGSDGDAELVARELGVSPKLVLEALAYGQAYPEEVERDIVANNRDPEELKRLYPQLRIEVIEPRAPAP
jgi:uncharacterized protein (DUF433 family)